MKKTIWAAWLVLMATFFAGCVVHIPVVPVGKQTRHGVYLGQRSFVRSNDKDHFFVGERHGKFSQIRLRVVKAPVQVKRVAVHFGNGKVRQLQVKPNFKANEWSRWIALPGGQRRIKKIVIVGATPKGTRRLGRIMVYARR